MSYRAISNLEDVQEFQSYIDGNSWNFLSASGVLFKVEEKWQVVYARIVLEVIAPEKKSNLVRGEKIWYFHIVVSFSEFTKFWSSLLNESIFKIDDIEAHTNFLTCSRSFHAHPKEQLKIHGIEAHAYYMIWAGNQTISAIFPDIDRTISETDPRYLSLKHACRLNLGIEIESGSTSPHIVVIAPFYVSLNNVNLENDGQVTIHVDHIDKDRLKKSQIKVYCSTLDGQNMSEADNYSDRDKISYLPPEGFDQVIAELRYHPLIYLLESKSHLLKPDPAIQKIDQMVSDNLVDNNSKSTRDSPVGQSMMDNYKNVAECRQLRSRIIQTLDNLNMFGANIFGVRLFKTEAMFFEPLENACIKLQIDHTNKAEFTHVLLVLRKLIESITDEAKQKALSEFSQDKRKTKRKLDGSISQISYLFYTKQLDDEEPFELLRSLRLIPNQSQPIHYGDSDNVRLLKKFNIEVPITDFHQAAIRLLDAYLTCINNLLGILKRKYYQT